MTVSAILATVTVGGLQLDVTDLTLTLDESRAPFATADLTVPYDPATATALDPRQSPVPRATVYLVQRFGASDPLAKVTADFPPPAKLSAITTYVGASGTLRFLTDRYGHPFNLSGAVAASRTLTLDLGIRARVINHQAGTLTLTLASDEALLTDGALVAAAAVSPVSLTVLAAVQLVLSVLLPGYDLTTTQGAQAIAADAAVWDPGTTGWDYLSPITASAGLRLWCDERRAWHLETPATVVPPGTVALSATGTVVDAQDGIDREATGWYDAVVVAYRWTDAGNVRRQVYDVAGSAASSRVLTVTYERPFPRAGEAAARLRKVVARGRVLDVEAVVDPLTYPGQAASLSVPGTPTQSGYVQAVTWTVPADRMRVTTRDLVDV